jgi:hypothetical protein
MIRTLIKWALIAVIAILTYNYFFGTEEEQRQSRKIAGTAKEMVSSVYEFIKDETARIQDGKYDDVVQNIQTKIEELKQKSGAATQQLNELEDDLQQAQDQINEFNEKEGEPKQERQDSIENQLNNILNRLEDLNKN